MNERTRFLTIRTLERAIADSTRPEKIRRACALRLSRLRAATTSKPQAVTTRTTAPAPAPTPKACIEAYESFIALNRQRRSLFNRRRSAGEQEIFKAMLCLMPASAPQGNDPQQWRNFIAQVSGLLEEIKSIKQP